MEVLTREKKPGFVGSTLSKKDVQNTFRLKTSLSIKLFMVFKIHAKMMKIIGDF